MPQNSASGGISVAQYLRSQRSQGGSASSPDDDEDVDTILKRRGSSGLGPLIRSIHQQESSGGTVDTSKPGNGGARGPMQVTEPTFQQMKREGRIPAEYRWDDPKHSTEAGIAYVESLTEQFGNDPRAVAQAYYGGPGAVGKVNRRDPRNPKAPTVGQYADQVVGRANGGTAVAGPQVDTVGPVSVAQYLRAKKGATQAAPAQPDPVAAPQQQRQASMPWLAVTQHKAYIASDDEQREAIRVRYFEDEIAPLVPENQREVARQAFDADTAPGFGGRVVDTGKFVAGGVVQGTGMLASGLGEYFQQGAEGVADIVQRYGGKRLETVDPLKGVSKAIADKGQQILDSRTTAAHAKEVGSTPEGDLDKPETWSWGSDPSFEGYIYQGAKVLGQFAPMIAAAYLTKGKSLATQFTAGATLGGLQGGGAAVDQARETLEPLTEAELTQQSETYRELRKVLPHDQARAKTIEEAEKWAFRLTIPVSAVGGAATAGVLSPATRIGTRLAGSSVPANMAARGVTGGLEEGVQETGEGIATERGINVGAGTERDVMTASVPNFVLGTLGGAPTGAGAGGIAARAQKLRERANQVRAGESPAAPTGEPIPASDVLGKPGEERPPAAGDVPRNVRPPKAKVTKATPRATPEDSTEKQPWQLTRAEFEEDAAYQGVNAATDESAPSYWFTDQSDEAAVFAAGGRGDGTAPRRTEPRIDIASKRALAAEWKPSERPSGSLHAYTGERKHRPIMASIPVDAASDPHRFLVERALQEGTPVPEQVLADYPDLARKYEHGAEPGGPMPDPRDPQFEDKNALRQLKNSLARPNSPRGVPWERDQETRASYERAVSELEKQLSPGPPVQSTTGLDDLGGAAKAILRSHPTPAA